MFDVFVTTAGLVVHLIVSLVPACDCVRSSRWRFLRNSQLITFMLVASTWVGSA